MRWGTGIVGIIVVGLMTFFGIYMILDGTIINEEEYHGLKEAMEGAMYDSIDIDYYHKTGEIKIIKEKFVEDFTRRFTETNVYRVKGFRLEFYDIIESPPKASVRILGHGNDYTININNNEKDAKIVNSVDNGDETGYDILNELDAILTYSSKHLFTYEYFNFGTITAINEYDKTTGITSNGKLPGVQISNLKMPEELQNIYNLSADTLSTICSVKKIEYVETVSKANFESGESNSAKKIFESKKDTWYKTPPSITGTYCNINTISKFKYTNSGVEEVKVTSNNHNCLSGYKYRVIWECKK